MNTVRSVTYGWIWLCVAGGGAYYFAKRSINADRAERALAEEQRRQRRERLRATEAMGREAALNSGSKRSQKASKDNTGSEPAPLSDQDGPGGKGKYEAADPWRSRKGDRFS